MNPNNTNTIISAILELRSKAFKKITIYVGMSLCCSVLAQDVMVQPEPAPTPESLSGRPAPTPSNLSEFVNNKAAAIGLGKALFWDMQLGSDTAPYDHPQLFIPNGHLGDENSVANDGQGRAKETLIELPATGCTGWTHTQRYADVYAALEKNHKAAASAKKPQTTASASQP